MTLTARLLIALWLAGFAASFVMQTVFQGWFATNSAWGVNVGWQNEIAVWNLGVIVMLVGFLRADTGREESLLLGLCVLSLCFGTNHAYALVSSGLNVSNAMGAVFNYFGVSMCVAYRLTRTESPRCGAGLARGRDE